MENQETCWSNSSGSEIMFQTNLLQILKQVDDTLYLSLYWNSYVNIVLLVVICSVLYHSLYKPAHIIRALDEVGYCHIDASKYKNRKTKAELVNEVRRRKQLGHLPPVYPNGWYALLNSSDIKAGQVKHVQALGETFAVMRTTNGQVRVLDAYCPHLGANMAVGGVVRGDCLECPFHGWQFRGEDGVCSHIPYSDKVPKSARVKTWTSCEVNRTVFLWYHAEGEPPSWHIERIPAVEEGWDAGSVQFTVNCHIQEIPENGADIHHFPTIHLDGFQAGFDSWTSSGRLRRALMRHIWEAQWEAHSNIGEEHKSTGGVQITTKLFEKFNVSQVNTYFTQIGPAYYIAEIQSVFYITTVLPIEPLLHKVTVCSFCPLVFLPLAKLGFYFVEGVLQRDILMWSHKKYMSKPLLCQEEESLQKHRRWFKQFYSANSPRYPLQQNPLEW